MAKKLPCSGRIAFENRDEQYRGFKSSVYVVDSYGFNPIKITPPELVDAEPEWSPDGKKLAVVSWRMPGYKDKAITLMNPDGSNHLAISAPGRNAYSIFSKHWSPDSQKIVFSADASATQYNPRFREWKILGSRSPSIISCPVDYP